MNAKEARRLSEAALAGRYEEYLSLMQEAVRKASLNAEFHATIDLAGYDQAKLFLAIQDMQHQGYAASVEQVPRSLTRRVRISW